MEIPVVHRSGVVAYEVKVALKRDLGLKMRSQCTRPEHTFRIAVETYEWGLALAGAFTGDELTDPVYFLDEGIENPDDPPEMQRQGFFVRRNDKAQDSYRLGAAAVVHLFHNDLFRFDFKNGGSGAGLFLFPPISFGLGVGDESDTRYFVGTSLRFGQKAYLTAGWAFGSIARLPNGLDEASFTTESNALGSLGSRTDSAFFLSLSFDFLKVGASSFLGAFETATPKPSKGKGSSGQGAGADTPQDDAAATAKKTVEASIVASLAATDDTDRFRSAGIFKEGFQGDRFCTLTVTEEPLGATVEVPLCQHGMRRCRHGYY